MQLAILILATWALGSAVFFGVLGLAKGDARIRPTGGNSIARKDYSAGRRAVILRKAPLGARRPDRLQLIRGTFRRPF